MKHKVNYLLIKTLIAVGILVAALILFLLYISRAYTQINVTPRNAQVFIDGKLLKVNSKGVYKKALSPGKHDVLVSLDKYVGEAQPYTFKRGIKRKISFNLKEMPKPELIEKKGKFLYVNEDNFYYLNGNANTLFKGTYNKEKSKLEILPITNPTLANIKDITLSPNEELALLRKSNNDLNLFDFKKYDFINQTEILWGQNIGSVAWSPDNSKIAYFYGTNEEKTLMFSNIANTERQRILNFENFEISNPTFHWSPNSQWLAIIPKNKDKETNKIYLFNTFNRMLNELTTGGNFSDAAFLSDSKLIGIKNDGTSIFIDKENKIERELDFKTASENIQLSKDFSYVLNSKNSLFRIDNAAEKNGLVIGKLADKNVELSAVLNEGKIIIYQTTDGIFSLNIQ